MMHFHKKKIVVLAPHTDDGELGCGSTISKALREGAEVHYIAFSTAEESVPEGFDKNQLRIEVLEATQKLGIPKENVIVFTYAVRKLNYSRQEILENLIKLRNDIEPDLIFLPSQKDIHQDHETITNEGIRAFKNCSILGYELVWNNLSFDTDCFIEIQKQDLDNKMNALSCYTTQHGKNYMSPDFHRSLAKVRGVQIGVEYAEAFQVIRLIMK